MPRPTVTSRRALLALVGTTALWGSTACDVVPGPGSPTAGSRPSTADPDQRLLDTAVTEFKVVREQVLLTVTRHRDTLAELSPVVTCLESHLASLGETDLPTPSPAGTTPGSPTTSGSPAPAGADDEPASTVPDDRDAALDDVVALLEAHARALTEWCTRAESGSFARLLAVMAAGTQQYVTVIRKARS